MASKSASNNSSSNKKKSTSSSNVDKFKCPEEFITRPTKTEQQHQEIEPTILSNIYLHPKTIKALELSINSICCITKVGALGGGIAGIVSPLCNKDEEDIDYTNIIGIPKPLRSVSNLLLGDRVKVTKLSQQPLYCESVTVAILNNINDATAETHIRNYLNKVGLVMPGMCFNTDNINFIITDLNNSTNDSDLTSKISNLSLENANNKSFVDYLPFLAPPGIVNPKKKTTIIVEPHVHNDKHDTKYNLPQPLTYSNVGGLSKEIEVLRNCINLPLTKPEIFQEFGVSAPRGVLLHGPPGTGKTMLLRCVANEVDAHVLTINGPSIVSKYLGGTESKLREIFEEARKFQPSIIFIDEIDSIAPQRNNDESGESESRVVASLLTLMDGFSGGSGSTMDKLVVVGATNRPNCIDSALRRPGRFDQEVEIGIPDVDSRYDILLKQFDKMTPEKKVDITDEVIYDIASKTHGYVGADLIALCRESVMKAIQRTKSDGTDNTTTLSIRDIEDALLEIRPSAMREIFLETPKVYWSDIGGQEYLKTKLQEMIELPLKYSDVFNKIGVKAPRGVLLYGPPGCSKTLTAKALATESGINFLAVKGPEVFNKYVGESEKAIREIFRKARAASPSIIFFDEIDALSPNRMDDTGSATANHVLTSLLNEIDGIEELNGVVIVAATNKPDQIDPALLRPGRLDRHIYVGPPDYDARLQIIKNNIKKFQMENEDVVARLSDLTEGCSGAEIVLMCQEAGLAAIMENLENTERVEWKHFEKALDNMERGITKEMLDYYKEFSK
ncbi:related to ATPase family gene 2 protein [Saccharomycodes ludwigii]|uniref:Related to ATPase family gene 2 protein n=1 Tax=Saccharomycodes ludwigii TaxID=36035 RepID=A0A376B6Q7_9ASCO|nr:hypothetical protein SCDLUD_004264 [Saccharomycodes ludwigii]KAH3899948.1 hypothetical protein SCDLUD_004264 [Saccharomycodes ludwigii]SSD60321.1 related to ATPase family gene 2 protein [Saccharomycodes ludwigii]